jgi:hypothetical protein
MATGTNTFTKIVVKGEGTYAAGTAGNFSSGGRRLVVAPTGVINRGVEHDTGSDRTIGVRNPILAQRVTKLSENPEISLSVPALNTHDLVVYLSAIQEVSPTGAGPDYDWTFDFDMTTGAPAPKSLQAIVTDGNQSFHVKGILPTSLELSAEAAGITTATFSGFAKAVAKTSQATAEGIPTSGASVAGRLWTPSYAASWSGLTSATPFEHLFDWTLTIEPGMAPLNAQAGAYTLSDYSQFAGPFAGTLSMTVASNAEAVAELYDKLGQPVFWNLVWSQTPAGSAVEHAVVIRMCAVPTSVQPIAADTDGIVTYAVEAALAYDEDSDNCLTIQVINELPALP